MKKIAHNLAKIAESLYSAGKIEESRDLFFTAIRIAHKENPLMDVLGEYGFEPSEIFEYGDDDTPDVIHSSHTSVHRENPKEGLQEIWADWNPQTGKLEYGYMHEGGDYGHKHAYYDNLEDLVAHIAEEDKEANIVHEDDEDSKYPQRQEEGWRGYASEDEHSCHSGGPCMCGGKCKGASSSVFKKEATEKKKTHKRLNKPFRTPGGPKKFSVYVKNDKGNIVKVNFGDPNMEIKRDSPERRKNFRARHHCETAKDPTKARTWSCRMWQRGKSVSQMTNRKKK
jgi:hypothetical protein